MTQLKGPEQPSQSGTTKQLVIILHGWGADGINLIDLARPWALALPDAHFCAPNAPHLCEANPLGYQWFSLMDRSPAQMLAGVEDAATHVNAFIDAKLLELYKGEVSRPSEPSAAQGASHGRALCSSSEAVAQNIGETGDKTKIKLALVGFSQGTMTALHVGLRRDDVDCILGYSGALLADETSAKDISHTPPICLIHGEADDVVPFTSMARAEEILRTQSVNITTHARPNLPHSIDMEGVEIGGKFLVEELG